MTMGSSSARGEADEWCLWVRIHRAAAMFTSVVIFFVPSARTGTATGDGASWMIGTIAAVASSMMTDAFAATVKKPTRNTKRSSCAELLLLFIPLAAYPEQARHFYLAKRAFLVLIVVLFVIVAGARIRCRTCSGFDGDWPAGKQGA